MVTSQLFYVGTVLFVSLVRFAPDIVELTVFDYVWIVTVCCGLCYHEPVQIGVFWS